jgi:hypothetical protein
MGDAMTTPRIAEVETVWCATCEAQPGRPCDVIRHPASGRTYHYARAQDARRNRRRNLALLDMAPTARARLQAIMETARDTLGGLLTVEAGKRYLSDQLTSEDWENV